MKVAGIVVDSFLQEAVRTEDVVQEIKARLIDHMIKGKFPLWDGDPLTPATFPTDELLAQYVMNDGIEGLFFTDEGGSEGVGVGFCSSDRWEIAFPWPEAKDDEDFLGNGDPMIYATTGKPIGEIVKGVEYICPAES